VDLTGGLELIESDRFPRVEVTSVSELHQWLTRYHNRTEAVWLVTYRKSTPSKYLTTNQVLDELVAFGWIDGVRRKLDDERTMQLISPRRTKPWARTYKVRAERLIAEGRMQQPGVAGVEAAKQSGAWDAMNDVDELLVPDDLRAALMAAPPAWEVFSAFPPSVTRNILRWVASAKTKPTRDKRIMTTTEEARHGRRVKSNG
jgi:uncharacterized protein YdeI (YjbR/CyaY-like superfamily)